MEDLRTLVLDTLYDRIRNERSNCFAVNEAGMELIKRDNDVLPIIESILSEIVEPALKCHDKQKDIDLAQKLRVDIKFVSTSPFSGLAYVLGAYWIISTKSNQLEHAFQFMNQCNNELLAEAIKIIPIFFMIVEGNYNFGIEPPTSLLNFVKEKEIHESARVREAAARALPRIDLPPMPY
ncbi:hypothetical protein F1728_15280 [Gimesia benthica]|uniref:Uncharacterized protein n=1 Tax=Gimesia benthica TaxID=2608982 RepID=A0A6I6AEK2_9PLAN|nr:hypothetical protein [Gimesia benthica]QGQ23960.1 hypothetical protein F1728_15280 [Gimesia benthica]